jgi:hypothetical protein
MKRKIIIAAGSISARQSVPVSPEIAGKEAILSKSKPFTETT